MATPLLSAKDLEALLRVEFPQVFHDRSGLSIDSVSDRACRVRQAFREDFLRPGGTISGPTMMALADFAMYVAVLARCRSRSPPTSPSISCASPSGPI
jgi:acyl-coenzyme A thioesterase PaaI-like protein